MSSFGIEWSVAEGTQHRKPSETSRADPGSAHPVDAPPWTPPNGLSRGITAGRNLPEGAA